MRRLILIISLLFFTHGCVTVPTTDMAIAIESLGCDQIAAEAVNSGEWTKGDWPDREWWKGFNDPTLSSLIDEALKSSPTLLKAESNMKAAYQKALEAKSILFPSVDFDAQDNWQHLSRYGILRGFIPQVYPAVINNTRFGLNFSYEFDFWGKNRAIFEHALGKADSKLADRLQAELILTTSIAYTYSETQLLLKKKWLLQQMAANLKEIETIRLKRNAIDNALVQLQATADSLDAAAKVIEIEQDIQTHIHKLKALSGETQDIVIDITYRPLNPLVLSLPENLSLDLIARRPDLIAQKALVEAAGKEVKAAKTDFYPNINFTAFFGLDSLFWDKLFLKKSYNGYINPALHLPIFTAGRLKAQLKEKVESFNEAVHAYDELILKAAEEVANSITTIHRFYKEMQVREKSLQIIQKQCDLTERRVQNALDSRISYLNAKNALIEMELILTEVEYGKQLSSIELIRALGGGFHG